MLRVRVCDARVCDGNVSLCAMCCVYGQVCDGSNFLRGKNLMKKFEAGGNAQLILKTLFAILQYSLSNTHVGVMGNPVMLMRGPWEIVIWFLGSHVRVI